MTNEKKWCVYVHTNKVNGKRYVGITSRKPEVRWGSNGGGYNRGYFKKAIKKYGWDNFIHEILVNNTTEEEAKQLEKTYIVMWQTKNREYGYNLTYGGDGTIGCIISEEHKKKISEAQRGNKNMLGKIPSKETRNKLSKSNKGKKLSDEHKKKISEAKKGKCGKKTICDNSIFNNARECAEFYGVNVKTMTPWLAGRNKTPQRFQDLGLAYYIEE